MHEASSEGAQLKVGFGVGTGILRHMTRHSMVAVGLVTGMSLVLPAHGAAPNTAGNPYQVIIDRNVFGLNPPPAPPSVVTTNTPPPQVKLVGIARVFGVKKALLKIAEGNKPVDIAKDLTVVLEEGAREKEVEVLQIDEIGSTVKVSNRGTEATLVFSKDDLKLPTSPAVPMPGIVPAPGFVPLPAAGGFSGIPAPPMMPAGTAPVGVPLPMANNTPGTGGSPGVTAVASLGNIPARPVRTVEQPVSAEEQIVGIEIERERTKAAVAAGLLPPLPPTVLMPDPSGQTPVDSSNPSPPLPVPSRRR